MSSIFKSILHLRCPRCHEGKLFTNPNPYHLKDLFKMPRYCTVCNLDLENEPGYYFGAMYVSYGLTAGLILANELWMFPLWRWNIWPQLLINTICILGLYPLLIRYSRAIYLAITFKILKK